MRLFPPTMADKLPTSHASFHLYLFSQHAGVAGNAVASDNYQVGFARSFRCP